MALARLFAPIRRWRIALAALAATGLGFAAAGSAQAQRQESQAAGWELCNETSYILEAATGRPEGESTMMQGWLRLRPGECSLVLGAPLARGTHFLHARSSSAHRGGRRQWGGAVTLCIDPNAQFGFENPPDCASMGLEERSFREVQVGRRDRWRTNLSELEPYWRFRARAAGLQRLLTDAGYEISRGRRSTDPRQVAAAIAQFRAQARLPANATEDDLIDALETAARRRSNELGLTLCNRAEAPIHSGIARRRGEGWESRGWWIIAPGACARTIDDALVQEVYYVHAELESQDGFRALANGGEPFCTSPSRFAIVGDENCQERYYDRALFSPIRTQGRRGLVVEFFDRDFLPPGQPAREFPRRRDAIAQGLADTRDR